MTQKQKISFIFFLQILIALLIILNGYKFRVRIDTTENKVFSISEVSKNILSHLSEPLKITYYLSPILKDLYPQVRDVDDFLKTYADIDNLISYTIKNPANDNIEKQLENIGIKSQQIESNEEGQVSYITVYSAITLEYLGKTEVIPFVLSTQTLEFEISSRASFLLGNATRKAAILLGNGLQFEDNYSYLVPWLESACFECDISYKKTGESISDFIDSIDTRTPLFIIGSSLLSSSDCEDIERFIMNGGNALFNVSRNNTEISADWSVTPSVKMDYIFPLLEAWGFKIGKELVLDISNYRIRMQSSSENTSYQYINYPFWIQALSNNADLQHPACTTFSGVQFFWCSPITLYEAPYENNKYTSILKTSESSWLMAADTSSDTPFTTSPFYSDSLKPDSTKGQYSLAASFEGNVNGWYTTGKSGSTRLIVISDQYFCSNMIEYTNGTGNLDFVTNSLLWLSNEDDILSIKRKGYTDTTLTNLPTGKELVKARNASCFISIAIIPLIFIALGIFICFLRRIIENRNLRP